MSQAKRTHHAHPFLLGSHHPSQGGGIWATKTKESQSVWWLKLNNEPVASIISSQWDQSSQIKVKQLMKAQQTC